MEEKLTPHRQAVLAIVRAGGDHPTAREVFERSANMSPRLSFATVYNALKYLTGKKLLRPIRIGDDAVRYDPILERHDHRICRVCGGVEDVADGAPPRIPGSLRDAEGFSVEEVAVQYHGVCAACRGAADGKRAGAKEPRPGRKRKT
jgi:Fur family peroxide stress response transcriptional regulator